MNLTAWPYTVNWTQSTSPDGRLPHCLTPVRFTASGSRRGPRCMRHCGQVVRLTVSGGASASAPPLRAPWRCARLSDTRSHMTSRSRGSDVVPASIARSGGVGRLQLVRRHTTATHAPMRRAYCNGSEGAQMLSCYRCGSERYRAKGGATNVTPLQRPHQRRARDARRRIPTQAACGSSASP